MDKRLNLGEQSLHLCKGAVALLLVFHALDLIGSNRLDADTPRASVVTVTTPIAIPTTSREILVAI
jgi:hypothetical protein